MYAFSDDDSGMIAEFMYKYHIRNTVVKLPCSNNAIKGFLCTF